MDYKPFVSRLVSKGSVPLYFIVCQDMDGRDCYYYLASTPEKILMYEKVSNGTFDLNDYGIIIASGYGSVPDDDVKLILKEKYGINDF
jgi:hypothetical protein